MSKFSVLLFKLVHPLFESINVDPQALELILQLALVPLQAVGLHVGTVQLVGHLDTFLSPQLGITVGLLKHVGHLLQFDGNLLATFFRSHNLGIQLLDGDLRMLKVLDDNGAFLVDLGLLLLKSLDLGVQLVDGVLKLKDLLSSGLFQGLKVVMVDMDLIFVFLLPFKTISSGLDQGLVQVSPDVSQLLKLGSHNLDLLLKIANGGFSSTLGTGQGIQVGLQVLEISSQFVLVQTSSFNGKLVFVQPLGSVLVVHLKSLLGRADFNHSFVELLNLGMRL